MNRYSSEALVALALIVAILGYLKVIDAAGTYGLLSILVGSFLGDVNGKRKRESTIDEKPPKG